MNRIVLSAFALAFAASLVPGVARAGAAVDGPTGVLCGMSSTWNPSAEPGTKTGEIDAGPLLLVDSEANLGSGRLTCTVQVGQRDHTGSGVSVEADGIGGFVLMLPRVMSYQAGRDDAVYLCTEFRYDNGTTLYYAAESASASGQWSTDPSAPCEMTNRVCATLVQCTNQSGGTVCVIGHGCGAGDWNASSASAARRQGARPPGLSRVAVGGGSERAAQGPRLNR